MSKYIGKGAYRMFCKKCGLKQEANSKFCSACGTKMDVVDGTAATAVKPENVDSQVTPLVEENSVGQAAPAPQVNNAREQEAIRQVWSHEDSLNSGSESKKVKKNGILGLAVVGVVVAIIIFIGIFVIKPMVSNGVMTDILLSANNTLEAGNAKFTLTTREKTSSDGDVDLDEYTVEGLVDINYKKETLFVDAIEDEDRLVLYDGTLYTLDAKSNELWWDEDMSSTVRMFFKNYDEYKEYLKDFADIDWEELFDELGVEDYVDVDKFEKAYNKFLKNLNDEKYIAKLCNDFTIEKSSKGKTYVFDISISKLVKEVYKAFEPAFEDLNIYGMDFEDILDAAVNEIAEADSFVVKITTKSKKLVGFEFHMDYEDSYWSEEIELDLTLDLKDVGKTSFDEKKFKKLMEDFE